MRVFEAVLELAKPATKRQRRLPCSLLLLLPASFSSHLPDGCMLSDGYLALILVFFVGSVGIYSLLFARRHLRSLGMPGAMGPLTLFPSARVADSSCCLAPLQCSRSKDTQTRESWRCVVLRCLPRLGIGCGLAAKLVSATGRSNSGLSLRV